MDIDKIENDFTEKEAEILNQFVRLGCIGLEGLVKDEHKINSMFGLYMSGKTYIEISKITRIKKELVYYMSAKMGWYVKRMEYLEEIQSKMTQKLSETRIESLNFITNLIHCHHKFYGDEINRYLETNDRTIIENLDLKALGQYFKSIEMLEKILNPTNVKSGGSATVNINAAGSEIKQVDESTIEINTSTSGKILRELSKNKDAQKKKEN